MRQVGQKNSLMCLAMLEMGEQHTDLGTIGREWWMTELGRHGIVVKSLKWLSNLYLSFLLLSINNQLIVLLTWRRYKSFGFIFLNVKEMAWIYSINIYFHCLKYFSILFSIDIFPISIAMLTFAVIGLSISSRSGPTAPASVELIRHCVFMPLSSVPHLPTNSLYLSLATFLPLHPFSLRFVSSMCVCLTYCCLFKLQFVNMCVCVRVCGLSTRPLNHTTCTVAAPPHPFPIFF